MTQAWVARKIHCLQCTHGVGGVLKTCRSWHRLRHLLRVSVSWAPFFLPRQTPVVFEPVEFLWMTMHLESATSCGLGLVQMPIKYSYFSLPVPCDLRIALSRYRKRITCQTHGPSTISSNSAHVGTVMRCNRRQWNQFHTAHMLTRRANWILHHTELHKNE